MVLKRFRDVMARAEDIIEDTILAVLSIFVIVLAVVALSVFATQTPAGISERVAVIGAIASLGFLAKAEYFAALMLPWVLMIVGLLVAREMWMIRRRLEGIHFEAVMQRVGKMPVRMPARASRARKRRRR